MVRAIGLFEVTPQHLCGLWSFRVLLGRGGATREETKMHFVSLWVTMTTSHSKVTHQSVYNMPFEHHGKGNRSL